MSKASSRYERAGEGERGIGIPGKWYAIGRFGRSAERRGPYATKEIAQRRWHDTGVVYARGEEERGDIIRRHAAAWDVNRRGGSPTAHARARQGFFGWLEGLFS